MIKSFRHKGLKELFEKGATVAIDQRFHKRITRRLDALDAATRPQDMNVPGFEFHPMQGKDAGRYTVHVNGPWCVTFEFEEGHALRVDFEQYH